MTMAIMTRRMMMTTMTSPPACSFLSLEQVNELGTEDMSTALPLKRIMIMIMIIVMMMIMMIMMMMIMVPDATHRVKLER